MNVFKKFIMNKGKAHNLKSNLKRKNSMNSTSKNFSFRSKSNIQEFSQNIVEEKNQNESPLKDNLTIRPILTPIQKLKHNFLKIKKKDDLESSQEFITPLKNKFSLNTLVNSVLYKIYLDKSYKTLMLKRLEPYMHPEKKDVKITIDLRHTQRKGFFYIPIQKHNPRQRKEKREIGIQSSLSSQNIFENRINISNISENINKDESKNVENNLGKNKYNNNNFIFKKINYNSYNNNHLRNNLYNNYKNTIRQYSARKKEKPQIIKNCKLTFNKYELINKNLSKNLFKNINNNDDNKYTKIKRIISTERQKMGKILDRLKFEQNNDIEKLKSEFSKLEGYISRKTRKFHDNSYNIFL